MINRMFKSKVAKWQAAAVLLSITVIVALLRGYSLKEWLIYTAVMVPGLIVCTYVLGYIMRLSTRLFAGKK